MRSLVAKQTTDNSLHAMEKYQTYSIIPHQKHHG